jgi:hypothetical protein
MVPCAFWFLRRSVLLACLLAGGLAGSAAVAQTHDLRYKPALGDKLTRVVVLNGTVAAMDPEGREWLKVPVYIAAKQTTEFTSIEDDSFTVTVLVEDLAARIADADLELAATEATMELKMDYLGRVLSMTVVDPPAWTFFTGAMTAVGPALLSIGRFKGEPVALGDNWAVEDLIDTGGKQFTAKCDTKLVEINERQAVLESTGEIAVPEFSLDMAGYQLDIKSGTLTLDQFRREFDLTTSKTSGVQAQLGVLLNTSTDVMKFGLRGTFQLAVGPPPPEEPAEAAQNPPAAAAP